MERAKVRGRRGHIAHLVSGDISPSLAIRSCLRPELVHDLADEAAVLSERVAPLVLQHAHQQHHLRLVEHLVLAATACIVLVHRVK